MTQSREHFESSGRTGLAFIRTLAGLILILGFFAAAMAYFVLQQVQSHGVDFDTFWIPGYFLSANDGQILSSQGDGEWNELSAGEDLAFGYIYKTASNSVALLRSSALEVEGTVFSDSFFSVGGEIDPASLTLISGAIHFRTQGDASSSIVVGIGNVLATLSGSCSVWARRDEISMELKVQRGVVFLKYKNDGNTLEAGDIATIENDSVSVRSGDLLPASRLVSPASGMVLRKIGNSPLSIEMKWERVDNAAHYKVEIARDVLFRRIAVTRRTSEMRMVLSDIEEGRYYWRVTAEGERGLVGETSAASPFDIRPMVNPDDVAVSAPKLEILETSAQSNLVSVSGQTEPGARVVVFLESYGVPIMEPREIVVNPSGLFRAQLEATEKGELKVVFLAFYRPEVLTRMTATVFVDF